MDKQAIKFKGNEEYLEEFLEQLRKYIILDASFFHEEVRKNLKQSLIKLLNSL